MLGVTMHRGRVVVRGACLVPERVLVEGESATLSCAAAPSARLPEHPSPAMPIASVMVETPGSGEPSHAAEDGGAARVPAPVVAMDATATARRAGLEAPASSGSASATTGAAAPPLPPASWRELARRSDYKRALAAAEEEGFDRLCEELAAAELMELGATARLGGRSARAAQAYAAVRRRFPGGEAAATAAFHLGQMTFDGAHAFSEAHRWFEIYLAERPGGALAAEALGRVMEAEQRQGDLTAARATAARYLARYPTGAHSALANSLLAP